MWRYLLLLLFCCIHTCICVWKFNCKAVAKWVSMLTTHTHAHTRIHTTAPGRLLIANSQPFVYISFISFLFIYIFHSNHNKPKQILRQIKHTQHFLLGCLPPAADSHWQRHNMFWVCPFDWRVVHFTNRACGSTHPTHRDTAVQALHWWFGK